MSLPSCIIVPGDVVRGNSVALCNVARADKKFGQMRVSRVRWIEDQLSNHLVGIRSPKQVIVRNYVRISGSLGNRRRVDALGIESSITSVAEERQQSTVDPVRRVVGSLEKVKTGKTLVLLLMQSRNDIKIQATKIHQFFLPFLELSALLCHYQQSL